MPRCQVSAFHTLIVRSSEPLSNLSLHEPPTCLHHHKCGPFERVLACPGASAPCFDLAGPAEQLVAMHHQGENTTSVAFEGVLTCAQVPVLHTLCGR
jgi:hypothetical protein